MDNSKYAPSGPEYPSAVEALKNVSKPVGITGAGTVGRCNPPDANFQVDFSVRLAGLLQQKTGTSRLTVGVLAEHACVLLCMTPAALTDTSLCIGACRTSIAQPQGGLG